MTGTLKFISRSRLYPVILHDFFIATLEAERSQFFIFNYNIKNA